MGAPACLTARFREGLAVSFFFLLSLSGFSNLLMSINSANKPVWPTSYAPRPELPQWFVEGLNNLGGGEQPDYRIVWGMDATTFRNDNPNAKKYPNPRDPDLGWACWMLERWATPEFFGNETTWEINRWGSAADFGKRIDVLGPFPRRGSYILVAPMMDDDYNPLPLTEGLLNEIRRRVEIGSQRNAALGILEIERRLKQSKSKEKVDNELEERREYYRVNGDRINRERARGYLRGDYKIDATSFARASALAPPTS